MDMGFCMRSFVGKLLIRSLRLVYVGICTRENGAIRSIRESVTTRLRLLKYYVCGTRCRIVLRETKPSAGSQVRI